MHIHTLQKWKHSHHYNIEDGHAERNTRRVIVLTLSMMIIEITAGYLFGSMALLADGWHMGTHAVALGITAFAYYYARRHSGNPNYSFGTGKVGVLGGFTSAVVLGVIALLIGVESIQRLISPQPIRFNEAIAVAFVGLVVNVISAFLLQEKHDHHHERQAHEHGHTRKFRDHNLRAAYFHVLADALTSVLAIIALFTGKAFGWIWMDPILRICTYGGWAPITCRPSYRSSPIFPGHPTITKSCWLIMMKSPMSPLRSIHVRVNPVSFNLSRRISI
jgi:cation diffusion facilitator family transporter